MHAIRTWVETDPSGRTGWLGALRDDRIGRKAGQRVAIERDATVHLALANATDRAQQRRLAGAVGAENHDDLAGRDVDSWNRDRRRRLGERAR